MYTHTQSKCKWSKCFNFFKYIFRIDLKIETIYYLQLTHEKYKVTCVLSPVSSPSNIHALLYSPPLESGINLWLDLH